MPSLCVLLFIIGQKREAIFDLLISGLFWVKDIGELQTRVQDSKGMELVWMSCGGSVRVKLARVFDTSHNIRVFFKQDDRGLCTRAVLELFWIFVR